MSDALWGVVGVAVGAGVTFGTTWWQLNRARDGEEKAYQRERELRRDERESVALDQLLDALGSWYSDLLLVLGSAHDADNPTSVAVAEAYIAKSPVEMDRPVLRLLQLCRDNALRDEVNAFLRSVLAEFHEILNDPDIHTREDCYEAVSTTAADYNALQARIGARLRELQD